MSETNGTKVPSQRRSKNHYPFEHCGTSPRPTPCRRSFATMAPRRAPDSLFQRVFEQRFFPRRLPLAGFIRYALVLIRLVVFLQAFPAQRRSLILIFPIPADIRYAAGFLVSLQLFANNGPPVQMGAQVIHAARHQLFRFVRNLT